MYVCTHSSMGMYVRPLMSLYLYDYFSVCAYVFVYTWLRIFVLVSVRRHAYIYLYIYIYIYELLSGLAARHHHHDTYECLHIYIGASRVSSRLYRHFEELWCNETVCRGGGWALWWRNKMVATRVMKSSSNELSTLASNCAKSNQTKFTTYA